MKLLIATTNKGKLGELSHFLSDLELEIMSLKDVGITTVVDETGSTFEENALLKAVQYSKQSGFVTLADDGGFEIDGLGGEPGVKSHRWVDPTRESSDEELVAYTIQKMKDLPEGKRGAQLRLVLAIATPEGETHTSTASVKGIVPVHPSGKLSEGFPYRSLLYLPEISKFYDHTMLTPAETQRFNHRLRAVEELKPILRELSSRHP